METLNDTMVVITGASSGEGLVPAGSLRMSRNTADTNRHHGGPGSSHQNADKPVDDPKNQPSGWQPDPVSPPAQTAAGSAQAGVSGIGIIYP